jgi:Uma2 family endonuclease
MPREVAMPSAELEPVEAGLAEESGDLAELLARLGDIPPFRVRLHPPPGQATEADLLAALEAPRKRICELVDGVLVEKAMGFREAGLAAYIITLLVNHVRPRKLGIVAGADGMVRLWPGRVRIPDVCFVARERLPGGKMPKAPIPDLAPDLAIEILSASNTRREMRLKRADYFAAGVRLVWEIDPDARTARRYLSADEEPVALGAAETLSAAPVLPEFHLALGELFAELD